MLPTEYNYRIEIAQAAALALAEKFAGIYAVILFGSTARMQLGANDIDILIKSNEPTEKYSSTPAHNKRITDTEEALKKIGLRVGRGKNQIHYVYLHSDRAEENEEFIKKFNIDKDGVQIYP